MIEKVLNNRLTIIYITPFILGILTVFSFQPFNLTFINFLIMPVIFLLINYVNKRSKNIYRKKPYLKNLFLVGYSFGVGFFFSGIYWVSYSLTFFDEFKYLIPFAVMLLPLFLGLFYGLVTLISGPYLKNNFVSILLFSVTFASSDYIRSKIFGGFPWNLWAYSWSWFEEVIQILNPIGLFAFNLIVITVFSAPALLIVKKFKHKYLLFFSIFFLIFSSYIYGSYKINQNKIIFKKAQINNELINVKIISPNFDLKYNLSSMDIEELLKKLIKYSDPNKNQETIFVWPEGVFAGYDFSELEKYQNLFKDKFDKNHTIIFGISTSDSSKSVFNSMLAVNNKLQIINHYNKKKLVLKKLLIKSKIFTMKIL